MSKRRKASHVVGERLPTRAEAAADPARFSHPGESLDDWVLVSTEERDFIEPELVAGPEQGRGVGAVALSGETLSCA